MNPVALFWNRLTYRLYGASTGAGKPVPVAALDREYASGAWDHFYGPDEQPRFDVLLGLLDTAGPSPSLLELGCGSGRLLSLIPPGMVSRYLGVDLSEEGLKRARALGRPGADFLRADFETWRPAEPWDLIVFNESIGYACDPATTVLAFSRHLTPCGRIIISHHRYGNSGAQWKRIESVLDVEKSATASNARGQHWDLKVLRPRP